MDIYSFLQNNSGVNITINAGQLIEVVDYAISKTKAEFEAKQAQEKMLTRKQTAELLNVNLTTLWRWANENYLCPVKIGRRTLYRLADVELLKGADA